MNRYVSVVPVFGKGLIVTALAASAVGVISSAASADTPVAKPVYEIQRAEKAPALKGDWESDVWKDVPALEVGHFYRADVSGHRPKTEAKVTYDDTGLYIHFRVEDRYVRSIETEYHGKVWEDACVEFFVEPVAGRGYFNFEINCGGTMLLSYQENPQWAGESLRKAGSVPWELAKTVEIYHSMPETVEPEFEAPTEWYVEYHVPFAIFEAYLGDLGEVPGQTWRANFYKCAENNSHPHWASWSLITADLNFHLPEFFSEITFKE